MTSDKTSRWLDLVAFLLQHRFPVTREQIFRQVGGYDGAEESARRKFERDKDELRAMGIEIETVPITNAAGDEPATGYRLRPRQAYLPYLELLDAPSSERLYHGLDRIVLSRAELEVLDHATRALAEQAESALASAAASARRKLAFDLPLESSSLRRILATPLPGHVRDALAVLQDAIIRRVAVSCRFTTPRSKDTIHVLQPWGLIFQWNRWYCVALASDHHEPRLVRIDRMRDVHLLTGPDASFSVPDDFDVRNFVGHWPWEFGNDQLV
ncbi:MAG: helix-turn-helix transcriptional regulator, partial [Vicinamibacterales bacterium]